MVRRQVANADPSRPADWEGAAFPAGLGVGLDGTTSLLEIVPDAVITTDQHGRITRANQRASELFGVANSDLVGRPVEDLIPPDARTNHHRHREHYSRSPRPRATHVVADLEAIRLDDGSTFPVDVTLSPMTANGEPIVVATIRDLSTTAGSVPALPLDQGHAETRSGAAADAVVRTDPGGVITWISLAVQPWLGWNPTKLMGRPIHDITFDHSEIARLTQAAVKDRRTTSGRVLLRNSSNPDGTWATVDIVPLVNTHRDVDGLLLSLRDADALTRAELARQQSEKTLRLAIENSPIGMAQATPDGRVFGTNRALQLLVSGRSDQPDPLIGSRLPELAPGSDRDVIEQGLRTCAAEPDGTWQAEIDLRREPLDPARVQLHLRLVRRPDRTPDHLLAQFVDLTAELGAKRRLAHSENRYRLLAEHASEVVLQVDRGQVVSWASPSAAEVFGRPTDEIAGRSLEEFVMWEDRREATRQVAAALRSGRTSTWRSRFVTEPGPWRWMAVHAAALESSTPTDGTDESIAIGLRDIHDQVLAEQSLSRSEQRFRLAMDGAPQGMALVGLHLRFLEWNEALRALIGRDNEWLDEHLMTDVIHEDDHEQDLEQRDLLLAGESPRAFREQRLVTANGRTLWVLQSSSLLRDETGMPLYYVEQFQDVTENRANREKLAFQARHDVLTKLANRNGFDELTARLFHSDQGANRGHAVLFCDLDNFKDINDQFGHAVGDRVLAAAAARVRAGIREGDIAARMGGDEFVILLRGVSDPSTAEALAEKLRAAVSQPIRNLDQPGLRVTMSVGVAVGGPSADPVVVLRRADAALYRAKAAGRNRVVTARPVSTGTG